ncbi:MAG: nucleotidyltransferase family protein [Bacteroidales bacterium]|nr:nucleotidyltransferase family protein [Bacteroidales bacterium]
MRKTLLNTNEIQCLEAVLDTLNNPGARPHTPDIEAIMPLLTRHRLLNQYIEALGKNQPKTWPARVQRTLDGYNRHILILQKQFLDISASLNNKGLWFVPLKGLVLASKIYKNPLSRYSIDIDLFIRKDQLTNIIFLLEGNGFKLKAPRVNWPGWKNKWYIWAKKDYLLVNELTKTSVELHYRLYPNSCYRQKEQALMVAHTKQTAMGPVRFNSFSPEFEFIYLASHGAIHGFYRLFWLYDLALLASLGNLNWQHLSALARQLGAERHVVAAILLAAHYFGTTVPNEINTLYNKRKRSYDQLLNTCIWFIENDVDKNMYARLKRLMYLLDLGQGFQYKWNTMLGGAARLIMEKYF